MKRAALPLTLFCLTCAADPPGPGEQPVACAAAGITVKDRFPTGSSDGHRDPTGARAARQARAGRIREAGMIRQSDDARSRVRVGDFLLINDRVAFYIEGARPSDGYSSLGGEILAVDAVAEDGRPAGISQYGETLLLLGRQAVAPESVTVLNDGSDGKAAVVRLSGTLRSLPFLETFAAFLPAGEELPAALDYVLEPGSERLLIRLSLLNTTDASISYTGRQSLGLFHDSRGKAFTAEEGYGQPKGHTDWVGFDPPGGLPFAFRVPGSRLRFIIAQSGFRLFQPMGFELEACERKTVDYLEIVAGGPGIDGLRAALRRVDGDGSWRRLSGRVTIGGGGGAAGALVHLYDRDGKYLSRTTVDGDGAFTLWAPPGEVSLVPSLKGYALPAPTRAGAPGEAVQLRLAPHGTIRVRVTAAPSGAPLPTRVQVIPEQAPAPPPAAMGIEDERDGRLHQQYTLEGQALLRVPPGKHRVVVSHGYEWELLDRTVTVEEGKETLVEGQLRHSVDSTGVMCADFHIHSNFSPDSSDLPELKVRSAVADGLEIPVSSEHEWIIDFQPIIERLGLTAHAFGLPSEELTTFTWGHFGVIPLSPRLEQLNNGAVPWIGRTPAEVFQEVAQLPERPVLIVNHPSGGGSGAYFSAAGFRRETGAGEPALWSDRFEAVEVFNDSSFADNRDKSVADWFALLNAGKVVWAVGSSDSHSLRSSPVGYPRTCLRFGHDDPRRLSAAAVRDALRKGAATISGGLYLTVEGPGGAGPGAMLPPMAGARPFQVTVQAPSWLEATTLEVIVDGETVETRELQPVMPAPGRRYEAQVMVSPRGARPLHWVVFHASARDRDLSPLHPGRRPFAVSNPIFF